ncbi:TRAP transporter large permease subunit [Agrococcus sp. SGAir0287]|uniref:TRAP transporter large permease subunit n=1 Tax=Agrococcus sp. SGAir0287 TaxID=2070347 RepID=UPI0010CD1C96|nr:TRAP transporter large permease subunit [Agrococcus sp. SGAir0287]QCR18103.1 C4-dicarboxylate ABC transporter permease [Agrococcus sp. SGAir0287]
MPVALIALFVFLVVIVVWNVVIKRSMAEAMVIGFVATTIFAGLQAPQVAAEAIVAASDNEIMYAAIAFIFMTYLVERTGTITRLIEILTAALGRLRGGPAIVDTVASGAMGAVAGGSNTGNAATSGVITGPWMTRTGWSKARAATVIAGNAGLGAALPPSASMVIMIGFAGSLVTTSSVYIALFVAGVYQFLIRMVLIAWFVRRDGIQRVDDEAQTPVREAVRRNWPTMLIFLGAVVPVSITIGPLADLLATSPLADAMGSVSLITWIPVLIILISAIVGWRELPRTPRQWWEFLGGAASKYYAIGALLFFAIAASEVLTSLGLADDVDRLLGPLDIPAWLLVVIVGFFVVLVAGPLSSSATLSAVGQVSLVTLVAAGIDPLLAVIAILVFASTEGASPPASGAIFVASGITGAKPEQTFIPLVVYYVLPFFILGVLIALGIVPVPIT